MDLRWTSRWRSRWVQVFQRSEVGTRVRSRRDETLRRDNDDDGIDDHRLVIFSKRSATIKRNKENTSQPMRMKNKIIEIDWNTIYLLIFDCCTQDRDTAFPTTPIAIPVKQPRRSLNAMAAAEVCKSSQVWDK